MSVSIVGISLIFISGILLGLICSNKENIKLRAEIDSLRDRYYKDLLLGRAYLGEPCNRSNNA